MNEREAFWLWTEDERKEVANEGQFGLFCSEDEACDIIQEVESLCLRKWKAALDSQEPNNTALIRALSDEIDAVAFVTMVQNSAGIETGIWGDEWLAWYEKERWLNIERALAVFIGKKLAQPDLQDAEKHLNLLKELAGNLNYLRAKVESTIYKDGGMATGKAMEAKG
jgi:hypothetical protein